MTIFYNTINTTQGLTPAGRRAITRSTIEGPNQDKSIVFCVHRRVPHMLKPKQYCPGDPRGRLSVVKHRQLASQVGAFGEFASESSMDLNNMIFPTGSTFIFGSWIYEADDNGKLQSHLLEDLDHHEDHSISTTMTGQLTGRFT